MKNKNLATILFAIAFASLFSIGALAVLDSNLTLSSLIVTYPTATTASCVNASENVTLWRNSTDVNSTENGIAITLPAGVWNYTCNSTENPTEVWKNLTVNKGPTLVTLFLDGNQANATFDRNWTANFTAVVNVTGLPINLTSNYTGFVQQNGTTSIVNYTTLPTLGWYDVAAWTEESANYTGSNKSYFFNVTDIAPQLSNNTQDPSTAYYAPGANYIFYLNVKDGTIGSVNMSFSGTNITTTNFTQLDANTRLYNVTKTDLAAGDYPFQWFVNDSTGLTNNTTLQNYTVNRNTSSPIWNFTTETISVGSTKTYSCWGSPTPNLCRNGICTGISLNQQPGTIGAGTYIYYCNITGNTNYTSLGPATITVQSSGGSGGDNTGGENTGGNRSMGVAEFKITDLNDTSIEAGANGTIVFKLKTANQLRSIKNIQFTLTGLDVAWYTVSPTDFTMDVDETKVITITFTIPADAELKMYPVTVVATGTEVATNAAKTASGAMVLTVTKGGAASTAPTGAPFSFPTITLPTNVTGIILMLGLVGGVMLYIFREQVYGRVKEMKRPIFKGFKPSPQPSK